MNRLASGRRRIKYKDASSSRRDHFWHSEVSADDQHHDQHQQHERRPKRIEQLKWTRGKKFNRAIT
jgi:hypothetical protein